MMGGRRRRRQGAKVQQEETVSSWLWMASLPFCTKQKKKPWLEGEERRREERELGFHAHLCSLTHCPPFSWCITVPRNVR